VPLARQNPNKTANHDSVLRFRTCTEGMPPSQTQAADEAPHTIARTLSPALINRFLGREQPAMERRKSPGNAHDLLVIGLAVTAFSLMALTDPLATTRSSSHVHVEIPVASVQARPSPVQANERTAASIASPDPLIPSPPTRSSSLRDARVDLHRAAAMARRHPWSGLWRSETQTEYWINSPASIGSTSPYQNSQ
jgi:hypothetical protein